MKTVFARLYEEYHQSIFQYIYYTVRRREIAEELVQEVYIKVLKAYSSFAGKSSEKTWIYSIARNVTIDWLRKENRQKRTAINHESFLDKDDIRDPNPSPEEIVTKREEIRLIYDALQKCSLDQQQVLILRYIQSLTIKETATILNWSESKVKTTQHRALQMIKQIVQQKEHAKEGYYEQSR